MPAAACREGAERAKRLKAASRATNDPGRRAQSVHTQAGPEHDSKEAGALQVRVSGLPIGSLLNEQVSRAASKTPLGLEGLC